MCETYVANAFQVACDNIEWLGRNGRLVAWGVDEKKPRDPRICLPSNEWRRNDKLISLWFQNQIDTGFGVTEALIHEVRVYPSDQISNDQSATKLSRPQEDWFFCEDKKIIITH